MTRSPDPNRIACACAPSELLLPEHSSDAASVVLDRMGTTTAVMHSAMGQRLSVAGADAHFDSTDGGLMVAFAGELRNRSTLARCYLHRADASESEIICAMYRKLKPRQLVTKLLGDWALVGYDREQERAFGARSGAVPLFTGKLANGSIVLSTFRPADSCKVDWKHSLKEVPAAHYVFGWRKLPEPLEFVPAEFEEDKHAIAHAERAAIRAMDGLPTQQLMGSRPMLKLNPLTPEQKSALLAARAAPTPTREIRKIPEHETAMAASPSKDPDAGRSERSNWWRRDVAAVAVTAPTTPPPKSHARPAKQPRRSPARPTSASTAAARSRTLPTADTKGSNTKRHKPRKVSPSPAGKETAAKAQPTRMSPTKANLPRVDSKRELIEEAVSTMHRIASGLLLSELGADEKEQCLSPSCSVAFGLAELALADDGVGSPRAAWEGRVKLPRRDSQNLLANGLRLVTM